MKKPPVRGGQGISDEPTLSPADQCCKHSGFACSHEFKPLALLRQGTREGWQPISYQRVADHYQYANPLASLMWADFERRCR